MRALIDAISLRNASLPCTIHRTICIQFVYAINSVTTTTMSIPIGKFETLKTRLRDRSWKSKEEIGKEISIYACFIRF